MKSKTLEKKFFFFLFLKMKWGGKKKKCDEWFKFCYSATKNYKESREFTSGH